MKQAQDYVCLECGKRLTLKQAELATNGDRGCPKCSGSDIDLYVESRLDPDHRPYTGAYNVPADVWAEAKLGA